MVLPDQAAIAAAVRGTRWHQVSVVPSTGSTNADLADGVRAGDESGRVLIADVQTAGRGRHQRLWSAPAGSFLPISVTVGVPTAAAPRAGWLSLVTGVAAVAAVREVTGLRAGLKWPNDVLLEAEPGGRGGKTAGILSELATAPGGDLVAVIGTGLNTTLAEADLPVETATSLQLAGAEAPDRTALAIAYLRHLDAGLTAWTDDPVAARADYLAACVTVGQEVTVSLPADEVLRGTAVDVDAEGRIVVQDATGKRHVLSAGDVTHLRPA
ncbi:biotin--[acetyl-CoA-carboxylase] ligase [Tsukamurella ocularis]|uniref:biotin--[acetyl-CoA-carboxylase] ligase n=1 Tax=Tsukamurella ocularis TaxID=1970234 RepID=UPI00216A04F4|nr:biotin--[acetyl-CoA-carboxylase] ligase [Tsukamurella ocularis]MCS3781642.1 BirA family biotin operon repressor/biotin-[acetyl-CoA-carboxylase] ligase [Tsukamurella ocularis]MCS3788136.1 BirA family biotin operon repressor/biotin-[acetyl-CoA-carboxylase] ligase [Tsukamurella ocularis]MCS3851856.1 BirA family biotin operon repressor/biotin-[acetyl-CoA-carboxylase] ligase [Tsukamurella ocularis]